MPGKKKIRVAISSCLLGEEVRYDGGHKRSRLCVEELSNHFEFVSICPEVGIGLGVPRKPIRLLGDPENPRAVFVEDASSEVTVELQEYAEKILAAHPGICGYIFIEASPSCGLHGVKVFEHEQAEAVESGRGVFARRITDRNPSLPVEEAGRLADPAVREAFVRRVNDYSLRQPGIP